MFFLFWIWFSFKNNRRTNVLLVGMFENAQKKLFTVKNAILAVFLAVNNGFFCVFKNTDQNNICVSIVLNAKTEKKLKKNWLTPKKSFFDFWNKNHKKYFIIFSNFAKWNIYAKTKPFLTVHMGPRSNILSKTNGWKPCDTVPVFQEIISRIFLLFLYAHTPWPPLPPGRWWRHCVASVIQTPGKNRTAVIQYSTGVQ